MTWRVLVIGIVLSGAFMLARAEPVWAYGDSPPSTPALTATPAPDLSNWVVTTPLPTATSAPQPGEPAGDPGPAVSPPPTSVPSTLGGWEHDPPTPTAPAMYRTLVVRVCLDVNGNRWCDADEGVAGMHVVLQDGATGLVRATSLTDRTGTAQWSLRVRPDKTLTVNIPYLGSFHTFTGDRQPEPVLVEQVPPLPGLLP